MTSRKIVEPELKFKVKLMQMLRFVDDIVVLLAEKKKER